VTTHPVLGGRWRTLVDSDQPVDAVPTEVTRVSLCLRDEEECGGLRSREPKPGTTVRFVTEEQAEAQLSLLWVVWPVVDGVLRSLRTGRNLVTVRPDDLIEEWP
jgi:hypothetical protein